MRKIYRQLIFACILISLGYWLLPILTPEPRSTVVSSGNAMPARKEKLRSYRPSLVHYRKQIVESAEDASPPLTLVDAVLLQTSEAEGRPVLLNYLVQLNPTDKNELQTVLNVAEEARTQLLADQVITLDSIDHVKQTLGGLALSLDGDFNAATARYLDNLDRRRHIKRDIAFHEEEIQGLKLSHRKDELTEAVASLQSLQTSLDALQVDIQIYETKLASTETRALLGSQYPSFCERVEAYKTDLAAALDQAVIIDKFDSIFAAMSSVHLEDI